MRRLAMPMLGPAAALLALSLAGLGLDEGGVVTGIAGVAFGAALRLASGTNGDGDAFAGASDTGGGGDE